jgi:hypothetical protein
MLRGQALELTQRAGRTRIDSPNAEGPPGHARAARTKGSEGRGMHHKGSKGAGRDDTTLRWGTFDVTLPLARKKPVGSGTFGMPT